MNIVRFSHAAAVECERQQVGLYHVSRLLEAASVLHRRAGLDVSITAKPEFWLYLAGVVEPINNSRYREVPVTFPDMHHGIPWADVPRAMETWWSEVSTLWMLAETDRYYEGAVNNLIRDFLKIHPFTDGNGRVAWLLRVWMLNQWDDPQPLPDYFGSD